MHILYDHQAFTIQEYGGISRYFYELIRELKADNEIDISGSALLSNNEYIQNNGYLGSAPFFKSIPFQRKTEFMIWLNTLKSYSIYKQNNFDIFHPTYYDPYFIKNKSRKPVIVTFHDLIHEKFIQYDLKTLASKRAVLNRADGIITISKNSKEDLIEYYNIPESRITIVPLASSFVSMEAHPKCLDAEEYLLYVGSRINYKNFQFFVQAIAPLLRERDGLFLYCSGGGKFTADEHQLFRKLKLESKIKYHSCTDENLKKLYANALAFIFPSVYEGFGLPLLEAMNCGCAVGASQTSSLPEVAADAAIYFDPYNKDSILSVVETLVTKPSVRSNLIEKGYARAKEFSWQKTAALTTAVYQNHL